MGSGLKLEVKIFLFLSILTELINAQAQYLPNQQNERKEQIVLNINKENNALGQLVVAIGESATILCQNPGSFEYCRFVIPDAEDESRTKTFVLKKDYPMVGNIGYFGEGLSNGHCGIQILNVQEKYNGNITCTAAVGPNEFKGLVNLFIARPPLEPVIENEDPKNPNEFQEGQRVSWKCIVRDGRPSAQIQWFIKDGEQYSPITSMNPRHQLETQIDSTSQLYSSTQQLERMFQSEDDGKLLVCRSIHEQTKTIAESSITLSIKYAPTGQREVDIYGLQLDKSNSISVQIKSNPRPRIEWKVDGEKIEERRHYENFIAPELQQVGPNLYNATLTIAPLTVEDLTKTFYLSAFNNIGRADFKVKISSADTPVEGLEIGAIFGIVIVLIILLIAISLLGFARITGKWCFSTKTSTSFPSEISDTESGIAIKPNSKSESLASFTAIFKKRSDKLKEIKKGTFSSDEPLENKENLATTFETSKNEFDPKENKQLFYAELMLKPNEDIPNPIKISSTTEYAEIMYVQKPSNDITSRLH